MRGFNLCGVLILSVFYNSPSLLSIQLSSLSIIFKIQTRKYNMHWFFFYFDLEHVVWHWLFCVWTSFACYVHCNLASQYFSSQQCDRVEIITSLIILLESQSLKLVKRACRIHVFIPSLCLLTIQQQKPYIRITLHILHI